MKTIVAGTRTIQDFSLVAQAIHDSGWVDEITEIVSGASEGDVRRAMQGSKANNVDILGAIWAMRHEIAVKYFPADWALQGPKAGPLRNEQMARYGEALILVWDGKSKGSADMLRRADAHGLRVFQRIVTE